MFSCSRSPCPCYFSHVVVEWTWNKACTHSSALKPCYPLNDLVTLPGYTNLTITILFHSNLCLDATWEPQPFLTILAIVNNISYVFRVFSVEWTPVILAGTHPKPLLWLPCIPQLDPICVHGFLDAISIYVSPHESMALLLWMNLISTSLFQQLWSPCLSSPAYFPACFVLGQNTIPLSLYTKDDLCRVSQQPTVKKELSW